MEEKIETNIFWKGDIMKKLVGFFLSVLMVITLAGCNDQTDENESGVDFPEEKVMAILKIDTVSTDDDAIDFAIKPVSEHVSM